MMKNFNRFIMIILSLMLIGMTQMGCKKGDTGPQGEQGEKGEQGDKGDKGDDGGTGTANVIYSDWASVSFSNSGSVYLGTIDAPKLTTDVLNKGEIAVYERTIIGIPPTSVTNYAKLPYTNGSKWINVNMEVGKIILRSNGNSISSYRYVLIPGGVQASAVARHLDFSDYNAVQDFYEIQ